MMIMIRTVMTMIMIIMMTTMIMIIMMTTMIIMTTFLRTMINYHLCLLPPPGLLGPPPLRLSGCVTTLRSVMMSHH